MPMNVSCTAGNRVFSLKNPVMPAPGSYGNIVEYRDIVDLSKLGAVVPNSFMIEDGVPSPRDKYCVTDCGYLSSYGPNNVSLGTFIDQYMHLLPDGPALIVNLKAKTMEDMAAMAAMSSKVDRIEGIEINLNCPYGGGGPAYWTDAKQLDRLVRMVREAAGSKLLFANAPGGDYNMKAMADVLQPAGVDIFVPFNCVNGIAVDVRKRTFQGGGYFGAGVKPYTLSRLREAVSVFSIPVIGSGGITRAEDVIEYILLGAFAVRIGSSNLMRPDFMQNLLDDLAVLMDELGIDSLDAIRGSARQAHAGFFRE